MSNWLENYTGNSCDGLEKVATHLQDMENTFITANDDYYKNAQKASDPTICHGKGATAFIAAVNSDINRSKYTIEGLGHAASAVRTLKNAIINSSQTYDGKLTAITNDSHYEVPQDVFDRWRDQLIQRTLDGAGTQQQLLDNLLRTGDCCILDHWSSAFNSVEKEIKQDADAYVPTTLMHGYRNSQQLQKLDKQHEQQFTSAFHSLAASTKALLQDWANDIEHEYPTFQNTLNNFDYLSARDLFYFIDNDVSGVQSRNKPITITPYTTTDGKTTGLLISISGTDVDHPTWDAQVLTALEAGSGIDNPYQADVENAIAAYMAEHPELTKANGGTGPEVTFNGYSLGGMVAQKVTDDSSFLSKNKLHVTNVVTYGAPVMGLPAPGVHYAMYDATYDPVPLMSQYENPDLNAAAVGLSIVNPNLVNPQGLFADYLGIEHAQELPWQQKLDTYIDRDHKYPGQIFNINDVGNNPAQSGLLQYPNFDAHQHYTISSQLNSRDTMHALPNIDPQSLGPTEYFGMSNPGSGH